MYVIIIAWLCKRYVRTLIKHTFPRNISQAVRNFYHARNILTTFMKIDTVHSPHESA